MQRESRAYLVWSAKILGLAAAYFITGRLGLTLAYAASTVTLIWPPTGISLVALLRWGPRHWPGVWVGALMVALTGGNSLLVAVAIATGNTLAAVGGVLLLRHLAGFHAELDRRRDVFSFLLLGVAASPLVGATIGTCALGLDGKIPWNSFGSIWLVWWLGDAAGILIVAPPLLTWNRDTLAKLRKRHRIGEFVALLAGLIAVSFLVFDDWLGAPEHGLPVSYLPFVFLVWFGHRFGAWGGSIACLTLAATAIWSTAIGSGPFARHDLHSGLILADVFIATLGTVTLLLTARQAEFDRVQRKLSDSEAGYRLLAENAHDVIARHSLDGSCLYVSPACRSLLGFEPEELVGTFVWDFVHPDDLEAVKATFQALLQQSSVGAEAFRVRRKDGQFLWMETVPRLVIQPQTGVAEILSIARDITDRKRVEESLYLLNNELDRRVQERTDLLRQSEERYRLLVEQATDGIFLHDRDGVILDVNRHACETLGYTRTELIGMHVQEFDPFVSTDRVRQIVEHVEAMQQVAFDSIHRCKDGSTFPVDVRLNPFDMDGQRVALAVVRDISERKRAEQSLQHERDRLRQILDAQYGLIAVLTLDGTFVEVNQTPLTLMGLTRDKVLGRRFWDFGWLEPGSEPQIQDGIQAAARGEVMRLDVIARFPGHGRCELDTVFSPLRDSAGRVISIIGFGIDITERKQAQVRQNSLAKILEESLNELYIFDCESLQFVEVNHAARRNLGYEMEELRHLTPLDLKPDFSRETFLGLIEPLQSGRQEKIEFETRHRRKDGTFYPVEVHLQTGDFGDRSVFVAVILDITLRRRAEEALRLQAQIMAQVHDAIIATDSEGGITSWNLGAEQMFGFTEKEVLGKHISVIYPENRHEFFQQVIWELQQKSSVAVEAQARTKAGSVLDIHLSLALCRNNQDQLIAMVGSAIDITERKSAVAKLGLENSFRESIISAVTDGICVCHEIPETPFVQFTTWNQKMSETTGYSIEEINRNGWYQSLYPDPDVQARAAARMTRMRQGDNLNEEHWEITRKDGQRRLVSLSTRIVPGGDAKVNVLAVMRDITEQRRIEDQLRLQAAALHAAANAIAIISRDGTINWVNPAFSSLTGYPVDKVIGKNPRILKSGKHDQPYYENMWKTILSGQVWHGEIVNRRKDGSLVTEDQMITPVKDAKGEIAHFIAIKQDITERKRQEEDRLAREAAERANQAKSMFLSRMSHELRTPLNSILGFSQLMEKCELGERNQRRVAQVLKAGRHLLDLINEVLDIARIEAGRITLSPEPISVQRVLEETMDLMRPLAEKEKLSLECRPLAASWFVLADNQRLKQVLLNLLSNAVKYNRKEGRIEVSCEEAEPGWLSLNVQDTGLGIAADRLYEIFQPFMRAGAERTGIEGTGLGLSLSKRLVELMGGRLTFTSEEGVGSIFRVELKRTTHPNGEKKAPVQPAAFDLSTLKRVVLYVEDNLDNLSLVEDLFSNTPGIRFLTAMQGSLGLDLARQHQPDLILLDVHLPDMQGDEFMRRLRGDAAISGIPVVVLSADAIPDQIELLKSLGVRAYLTKPLDLAQVVNVVTELLRKKENEA